MAKSVKVNSTLKDAGKGHSVWKEDLNFVVGETKFDDFVALFNAAEGLNKDCAEKDAQLAGLKNTRDEKTRQLQGIVTRFRSIARGHYGPGSAQYKQAGGTPLSARRSSARKSQTGFGKSAASRIVAHDKL